MKKDTFYFPHDYHARMDLRIQPMIFKYGAWGYGVFWVIIEVLHEESQNTIIFNESFCNAIAMQMKCKSIKVEQFINDCINEFGLFKLNGNELVSKRVMENINRRTGISEKRKQAALKRWDDANAMQNDAKERKGKDSIEEDSKEEKKKEKEKKKTGELHSLLKKIFLEFYNDKKGFEYSWNDKRDTKALNQLILGFKIHCKEEEIPENFLLFLNGNKDKWVNKNFNVSVLEYKFNDIVADIKSSNSNLISEIENWKL